MATPQRQRSCKAAWEKMVSATEAIGGHRTEKDRETSAQRGRGRRRGPSLAQGHPCGEQMGGRREREAKKG